MNLVRLIGSRRMRWAMLPAIKYLFYATGRNWNDFYAWMLNFQDRKVTLDQILRVPRVDGVSKGLWDWGRGDYCVEFMAHHGVMPHHRVLDFGCGYGRVAIPLLRQQQGIGKYIGVEISKRRLALAREWVRRENLDQKNFEFILSKDNSIRYIDDNTVDVIWTFSVYNHMPDSVLAQCLKASFRILKPGGVLFCYYSLPTDNLTTTVKDYRRTQEKMHAMLKIAGFSSWELSDWNDDLGENRPKQSRMAVGRKVSDEVQ